MKSFELKECCYPLNLWEDARAQFSELDKPWHTTRMILFFHLHNANRFFWSQVFVIYQRIHEFHANINNIFAYSYIMYRDRQLMSFIVGITRPRFMFVFHFSSFVISFVEKLTMFN